MCHMKSFYHLTWLEKCDMESGRVNPYDYLTGYDFNVKSAVEKGQRKKDENIKKFQKNEKIISVSQVGAMLMTQMKV